MSNNEKAIRKLNGDGTFKFELIISHLFPQEKKNKILAWHDSR